MEKTTNCLGIVSDLNDRIPMMQIKLTALLPGDICVSVPNTVVSMGNPLYRVWVMVFNATSKMFQLYRGGQFYWWRKQEYPEKTTSLSQVTKQLYHI